MPPLPPPWSEACDSCKSAKEHPIWWNLRAKGLRSRAQLHAWFAQDAPGRGRPWDPKGVEGAGQLAVLPKCVSHRDVHVAPGFPLRASGAPDPGCCRPPGMDGNGAARRGTFRYVHSGCPLHSDWSGLPSCSYQTRAVQLKPIRPTSREHSPLLCQGGDWETLTCIVRLCRGPCWVSKVVGGWCPPCLSVVAGVKRGALWWAGGSHCHRLRAAAICRAGLLMRQSGSCMTCLCLYRAIRVPGNAHELLGAQSWAARSLHGWCDWANGVVAQGGAHTACSGS